MKQRLAILGSTGSIGTQTLEVVDQLYRLTYMKFAGTNLIGHIWASTQRVLIGFIAASVVVLLDVNKDPEEMVELVNPEVIEQRGAERVVEGCLSVPGVYGYVTRPTWAKIRAQDRFGNWFEREGEGIVAQCFCHETEHLDGHLFIEKVEEYVDLEQMQDGEEE